MRRWDFAWLAWLVASVASFGVLEGIAIRRRCLPTLSHTLQRWFGVKPVTRRGKFMPFAFVAFWIGLAVHVVRYQAPDEIE